MFVLCLNTEDEAGAKNPGLPAGQFYSVLSRDNLNGPTALKVTEDKVENVALQNIAYFPHIRNITKNNLILPTTKPEWLNSPLFGKLTSSTFLKVDLIQGVIYSKMKNKNKK